MEVYKESLPPPLLEWLLPLRLFRRHHAGRLHAGLQPPHGSTTQPTAPVQSTWLVEPSPVQAGSPTESPPEPTATLLPEPAHTLPPDPSPAATLPVTAPFLQDEHEDTLPEGVLPALAYGDPDFVNAVHSFLGEVTQLQDRSEPGTFAPGLDELDSLVSLIRLDIR